MNAQGASGAAPSFRGLSAGQCLLGTLTLASGYALKRHYSTANPDELTWILAPTTALVEAVSGHTFFFEPGVGFTSATALVAVTKACAGVNFLIVALVTLALSWLSATRSLAAALTAFAVACGTAYTATLLVNGTRILWAIRLHREHQLEGIVLYVGALIALHAIAQCARGHLFARRSVRATCASRGVPWLPLGLYCGMTIVVPVLNGAALGPEFQKHAGLVLMVSITVGFLSWRLFSYPQIHQH